METPLSDRESEQGGDDLFIVIDDECQIVRGGWHSAVVRI
jgi:hypothetical protein